jgi:hypothetical protein
MTPPGTQISEGRGDSPTIPAIPGAVETPVTTGAACKTRRLIRADIQLPPQLLHFPLLESPYMTAQMMS